MKPRPSPRLTNCPARTSDAIRGASNPSTHMSRETCRRSTSGALSRCMGGASPFLDRADVEVGERRRGRLEQGGGGVERSEARDAPLDGGAPDLKTVLDHRAAIL